MCRKIAERLSRALQNAAKHCDGREGKKKERKALAIERNIPGFNLLVLRNAK
jgi:hypothetical protein